MINLKLLGAVVGLGGLGITTKYTLCISPSYTVKQIAYIDLPISVLKDHFEEIMSAGYSVSFFLKWQNKNVDRVYVKSIVEPKLTDEPEKDLEVFGAKKLIDVDSHPIIEFPLKPTTEQNVVKIHVCFGKSTLQKCTFQTEYFVPIEHSYDAIMAVESLHEQIGPWIVVSEIRTIDADEFWMSPFYKQRCTAIHFTWKQDFDAVR